MPDLTVLATAIHALGAAIWVGGMFFAYVILRPSLGAFEPPFRLKLWNAVFERFFFWVWIIVIAIPVTGYWQVYVDFGGFEDSGLHVNTMNIIFFSATFNNFDGNLVVVIKHFFTWP